MLLLLFKSYQEAIFTESQVAGDVITAAAVKVSSVTVTKFLHLSFISLVYYQTCIITDPYTEDVWWAAMKAYVCAGVWVNHFVHFLMGKGIANTLKHLSLI